MSPYLSKMEPGFNGYTVQKIVFPRSWNNMESSKRLSKYYLKINFLAKKETF